MDTRCRTSHSAKYLIQNKNVIFWFPVVNIVKTSCIYGFVSKQTEVAHLLNIKLGDEHSVCSGMAMF